MSGAGSPPPPPPPSIHLDAQRTKKDVKEKSISAFWISGWTMFIVMQAAASIVMVITSKYLSFHKKNKSEDVDEIYTFAE